MEMTLLDGQDNAEASAEAAIEDVVSPIRRDSFSTSQSPGTQPTASSPRLKITHGQRRGLLLSEPKSDNRKSPVPFNFESSSASSSLSESESSPRRSPQAKRTNEASDKEMSQTETASSSSTSGDNMLGMKKFKRRNQAIYSSAEEDM
ncbi:uncharacterized protein LOC134788516 [Penaeus indicus]|uniref:uncharacterized protein LOC134788516 n=1 Tax=Penaeus indicus TaxID=29960 RepID=UPI00300D5DAE